MWRALVVDDCAEARRVIIEKLRPHDFRVFQATDVLDAIRCFPEAQPDIVITDLRMPGEDGIELLRRIREFSKVPVIVLTSYPTVPVCEDAILSGAQRFLQWREDIGKLAPIALELLSGQRDLERPVAPPPGISPARARRREEFRAHLESLVRECNGNISQIAERLHRDRSTVTYHLRRFGLFDAGGCRGGRPARAVRAVKKKAAAGRGHESTDGLPRRPD